MAAEAWVNIVPESASSNTPIPLSFWKLIQQSIPVYRARVTTAAGGVSVSLPAAFTSAISSANQYCVQLTKETFDADGGELYISDKATSGFKVKNSGGAYGEIVAVTVFWIPA
jgi:hypothetical protein